MKNLKCCILLIFISLLSSTTLWANDCECLLNGTSTNHPEMGLLLKDKYYQEDKPGGFTSLKSFSLATYGEKNASILCDFVKYEMQNLQICPQDDTVVDLSDKELFEIATAPQFIKKKENCSCLAIENRNVVNLVHSFTLSAAALLEYPYDSIETKNEAMLECKNVKEKLQAIGVCKKITRF